MRKWRIHYGVEFGYEINYVFIESETVITAATKEVAEEVAEDMAFDWGIDYLIKMGYNPNSEQLRNMVHDGVMYIVYEILK